MNTDIRTKTAKESANGLPWHVAGLLAAAMLSLGAAATPGISWQNLSSKKGDLPCPPGGSTQQTGAVVGDFDGDGVSDGDLDLLNKPYTWDTPRVDVWLNNGTPTGLLTLQD